MWLTWRDVLHLVDIICCCAILFPIVWSIRHLFGGPRIGADGKAENNLMKLTLFRQFYIMVVTYIYFTRIVVFLLAATLPFQLLWLRYLFTELATLAFYVVAGVQGARMLFRLLLLLLLPSLLRQLRPPHARAATPAPPLPSCCASSPARAREARRGQPVPARREGRPRARRRRGGADDLEEFGLDEGVELPGLKQAVPAGPAGPTAPGPTEGVLREKVAAD